MRLTIQHETRYSYTTPPVSVIELLRLTPCNTDTQSVREWRIDVSGDAALKRFEDAFGNINHTFTTSVSDGELTISATGMVETTGTSGMISGGPERLPVGVYLRETDLTMVTPELVELAFEARGASDGSNLDFAHTLNGIINERIVFDEDATHTATPACDALEAGRGVCQDLAHILIASARAGGLPARYVSGYQFAEGRARDEHAGHAWVELFIEDLGWVAFDPTAGASSNESYVRVASGLDYLSAGPIRGATYGGDGEELEVSVVMDDGSQRHQSQSQGQGGQSQTQQ